MLASVEASIVPYAFNGRNSEYKHRRHSRSTHQQATSREGVNWIGLPDVELSKLITRVHWQVPASFRQGSSLHCVPVITIRLLLIIGDSLLLGQSPDTGRCLTAGRAFGGGELLLSLPMDSTCQVTEVFRFDPLP